MKQREIKFRVWDNVDYMSEPFTLQDLVMGKIKFTPECKVMQFTGLTDKNGVEIYEGDIIKGVNGSINCVDWVFEPYVIKWNNEECKFNVPLWGTFDNQDSTHWFEVIGNIHQHKHLLK